MIYRARYIIPISSDLIENAEVLVREGVISEVGVGLSVSYPKEPVRDLGSCALLPGFVNAHSHIDYTMGRNSHDALNLWDWLLAVGFRKGRVPDYDLIVSSAMLGAGELALSGVTCLGDSSFSGAAAEAMDHIGLRGIVYKEIFGQSMGDNYVKEFDVIIDKVRQLRSMVSERIKFGLSPHSLYTSSPEVLKYCAESCAKLDMPISIHLSETNAEADYCINGTGPIAEMRREMGYGPMVVGKRPAWHLQDVGLMKNGVSLAHCVHIDKDEIDMIAQGGASIVHCPRSNALLGTGIAPLVEFMRAGAIVGLGTDSAGSCGRLDFFDEMRFALGFARAQAKDAGVVTAKDILRLATLGGAQALGLDDQIGTLEAGKRADMVAVDLSDMLPGEDLYRAILSARPSNVKLTMVDGVEVASNGRLLREDLSDIEGRLRVKLESQSIE